MYPSLARFSRPAGFRGIRPSCVAAIPGARPPRLECAECPASCRDCRA